MCGGDGGFKCVWLCRGGREESGEVLVGEIGGVFGEGGWVLVAEFS